MIIPGDGWKKRQPTVREVAMETDTEAVKRSVRWWLCHESGAYVKSLDMAGFKSKGGRVGCLVYVH